MGRRSSQYGQSPTRPHGVFARRLLLFCVRRDVPRVRVRADQRFGCARARASVRCGRLLCSVLTPSAVQASVP